MLSVDWEPDHGKWERPDGKITYRGILEGTPVLQEVLDRVGIPFTWFLETSQEPDRNTPTLFPDLVRGICARQSDEVGLHIHWRRLPDGDSAVYETNDAAWVQDQIEYGVRQFLPFGIKPRSFRSGALLHIKNLPKLLSKNAFVVDSSTLWDRSQRLNQDKSTLKRRTFVQRLMHLVKQMSGPLPRPYCADWFDVEKVGNSQIVEFPISGHALDLAYPLDRIRKRVLIRKAGRAYGTQFVALFFHIDELMHVHVPGGDQPGKGGLVTSRFGEFIERLKKRSDVSFATFSQARAIYQEGLSGRQSLSPQVGSCLSRHGHNDRT